MIAATSSGGDTLVQITPGNRASVTASKLRRVAVSERDDRLAPEIIVRAARIPDMRGVGTLVNGFAGDNLMLPKTYDQLARHFREFVVAVGPDDRIVGCGALRVYSDELAEVSSLAVDESVHGAGIGRRLVERLLEEARALRLRTVFALTLQDNFFHRLGFRTVPRDNFPGKVWADCRTCPKLHACDEIAVAVDVEGRGGEVR